VKHQQVQHSTTVRSAHTVFMCFVFIWEQTATCASYSINWLVFITEMKSVYSAVRTGSLNKAVCASSLNGSRHESYKTNLLIPTSTIKSQCNNYTACKKTVLQCFTFAVCLLHVSTSLCAAIIGYLDGWLTVHLSITLVWSPTWCTKFLFIHI
jgi:hypothetical protein